jgi:hypothetical protein
MKAKPMVGLVFGLLLYSFPCVCAGRTHERWPYAKLLQRADLVIVGKVARVRPADDVWEVPPHRSLSGLLSTIRIEAVLKGKTEKKEVTVFHYEQVGKGVNGGPTVVNFRKEMVTRGGFKFQPVYLIFLKKRKDGFFECVSGQDDPGDSVRVLTWPEHENGPELDLNTANLFHKRLAKLCVSPSLHVLYDGPLSRPRRSKGGVELNETPEIYVRWSITWKEPKGELQRILARISISMENDPKATLVSLVNQKRLYVRVEPKDRTIDDPIPGNGKLTLRNLLRSLEDE